MDPLMVDIALLRALETPELKLAPGRAVMARVITQEAGRGAITIAGAKLDAQLPSHLKPGDELRLTVKEVSADKVVLAVSQEPPPAAVAAPPPPRADDLDASEEEAPGQEGEKDGRSLTVRYPAPALGAVDLRFELDDASLRITVALAPGEPFSAAQAAAAQLREAVTGAVDRPVSVTVIPRREPLDVYA
jgi:hypothetical protein